MSTSPYPQDSLQRLQAIERDIVAVIDKICRENDIEYFIDGGTCLGAVRHGGFIPWDDDVDLGMPKADYDRFCAIAPELLPAGYSLHTSTNTRGFSGLWAKVFKDGTRFIDDNSREAGCEQGVFVDIFPYCQLDADSKICAESNARRLVCPSSSHISGTSRDPSCQHRPHCVRSSRQPASSCTPPSRAAGSKRICRIHSTTPSTRTIPRSAGQMLHIPTGDRLTPRCSFPRRRSTSTGSRCVRPMIVTSFSRHSMVTTCSASEEERYTHAPVILDLGDGIDLMK